MACQSFPSPLAFLWTNLPAGVHRLEAVAVDQEGLFSTSTPVTLTVTIRNDPPTFQELSPSDGSILTGNWVRLQARILDPEGQPVNVRVYGRRRLMQPPAPDFTVVALPDTQYYSKSYPHLFTAQTDWIVAQRLNRNIGYVAHLGDITEDAVNAEQQWARATNALSRLEDPATTGLPFGIPYGVVPGNHDHISGITYYNQYFGPSRFEGRPYYGGHFGSG